MTAGRLTLTVLGSAAAWTRRAGHASSSYLVEVGADAIVLDLGQGAFAALGSLRDPASVRAVFISHLHPDHGVDLVPLRHYLLYGCEPPAIVALNAPADTRRRYDALLDEADFLAPLPGPPLQPGTLSVPPFDVTVGRVTHMQDSFAFRVARASGASDGPRSVVASGVAPGRGLVYSGDCARWEDLVPLIRTGDTLLCEAFFGSGEPIEGVAHLTAAEAARAARNGGAARLLLTHLKDSVDADASLQVARSVFDGEVVLATPGLRIAID